MGVRGINLRDIRLGEEKYNKQGSLMKIIQYNTSNDITVVFLNNNTIVEHNTYKNFKNGLIKDPYFPSLYGVGIIGNKYQSRISYKLTKEYTLWSSMLYRCYQDQRALSYKNVIVCDEWLYYENFYEWLHNQENFNKWISCERKSWDIDKDILIKGNKIYSPDTCCLVPQRVNELFIKRVDYRGELPIGVILGKDKFIAQCHNNGKQIYLGSFNTDKEAFLAYKKYKEKIIKQIAQEEYDKRNITTRCYEAMMAYEVEITD